MPSSPGKDWSISIDLATFEGKLSFSTSLVGRMAENLGGMAGPPRGVKADADA
jgi:hypothetical protein